MTRRSVTVPGLEHGANPVPAACRVGPLLTTGAVRGVDRGTGRLPDDLGEEVRHAFVNLGAIVAAGGASVDDVAHVTVFAGVDGIRDALNHEWVAMFPDVDSRPARHLVRHDLPGGMRVQVEAIAWVAGGFP